MLAMRKSVTTGVVVGLIALTACQTGGPGVGPKPAPTGFEGEWTDGVATSTLGAGKFSSRVNVTGETVTTGTYTIRDPQTIDLSFYSVKSKQNTQAACLLVNLNQLNCTLASGTRFTLNRKVA